MTQQLPGSAMSRAAVAFTRLAGRGLVDQPVTHPGVHFNERDRGHEGVDIGIRATAEQVCKQHRTDHAHLPGMAGSCRRRSMRVCPVPLRDLHAIAPRSPHL
jgi:hypothetical protein